MSNQVVNSKFRGVSQLFSERHNYNYRRRKDMNKFSFRDRSNRIGISRKLYKAWNTRRSWAFSNKNVVLNNILKLKYYWFSHKFLRFSTVVMLSRRRLLFKNLRVMLKNKHKIFRSFFSVGKNLRNLYLVDFFRGSVRSITDFLASKSYSLSLSYFNLLARRLKRTVIWKYFPNWIFYKLEKIIFMKKRALKRKIMAQYLLKMFKMNSFSIYKASYIGLLSNFLYGKLFKIVAALVKLDLQKYSQSKVSLQFKFIGGVTMTPNVILKYLLYKLARLHLPTEMIPKLLYKFSGFLRKTTTEIDTKEKFKINLLGGFYANRLAKKKVKNEFKFVRAFSPFLKGLLFKCNGRFTRKQMSSHLRFSKGVMPLSTISRDIRYVFGTTSLKYGSLGINIYFNYGVYSSIVKRRINYEEA